MARVPACGGHSPRSCAAQCGGMASADPIARGFQGDPSRAPARRGRCGPSRVICAKLAAAKYHDNDQPGYSPTAAMGAVPQIHVPCGPRRRSEPVNAQMGCTAPVTRLWAPRAVAQLQPRLEPVRANHDCQGANQPLRMDPVATYSRDPVATYSRDPHFRNWVSGRK